MRRINIQRCRGMSYEQASREGARLVREADATGNWFAIVEPLAELRNIMQAQTIRMENVEALQPS